MGCLPQCCTKEAIQARLDRIDFNPRSLRGFILGMTLTITIGEITAYGLIKQDAKAGEIPYYTPDLLIVIFSIFEALIAPFMSWWGYRRRRSILLWYSLLVNICVVFWFFMPSSVERNKSGLCSSAQDNGTIYEGMTSRSIARLILVLFSCVIFVLVRVSCWCHGMAYIDEYAPERPSMHFGVLLLSRIVVLIVGYRLIAGNLESNFIVHNVTLVVGFAINVIQVPFIIPKVTPEVDGVQRVALPLTERGFLISIGRVLFNSVAMMQILAMGLMAAAIWGFGYNDGEIVKEKFLLLRDNDNTGVDILMHYFVIAAIALAGYKLSAPILMEFNNLRAVKTITIMSLVTCIVYIIITTVPSCEKGVVAGLEKGNYGQPTCSLSCNCTFEEFKPVCIVDTMITYVSPCQAGCSNSSVLNTAQVYSNCSCSTSGRAISESCSYPACKEAQRYHSVLFMIVATFTLLVFQSQGVLILRTVDRRDKSVAMGLMWSMVAITAFVCGHLLFYKIQVMTCAWSGGEECRLQEGSFPYYVGGTSAILAFSSTVISIISWICIRIWNRITNTPKIIDQDGESPIPLL